MWFVVIDNRRIKVTKLFLHCETQLISVPLALTREGARGEGDSNGVQ